MSRIISASPPCLRAKADGDYVHKGVQFGKSYSVVVAERVALNFMQRMSGIANFNKCTLAMADAARPACILETRKTAPGLRLVDKWAVLIGGVKNHRIGLFDMVMIKDNHISIAGGVTNAIRSVDMYLQQKKSQDGCRETSVTRIMLDNMVVPLLDGDVDVSMLQEAVKLINGKFETECSCRLLVLAKFELSHYMSSSSHSFYLHLCILPTTNVSYAYMMSLTAFLKWCLDALHSVKALDISLKIDRELALKVGRRTKRA
ncbi:hypothetical protein SAY87_020037 [Trapa incisa]|uniref:Quinolinate phosphoribosyl transferase C-terminal domain-containing protein n=1 Tax=Trapa incisa TaxID=236973 RepID=A0AAN7K5X3_9MYRT|nr:hypothetical protein SAY87_020037 [Trapa incisa]